MRVLENAPHREFFLFTLIFHSKTKVLDVLLSTGHNKLYMPWICQGVFFCSLTPETNSKILTLTLQTHFEAMFNKQEANLDHQQKEWKIPFDPPASQGSLIQNETRDRSLKASCLLEACKWLLTTSCCLGWCVACMSSKAEYISSLTVISAPSSHKQ